MGGGTAPGLLTIILVTSLGLAGCLGGPSIDDMDLDALPSEYDTPQHAQEDGQDEGLPPGMEPIDPFEDPTTGTTDNQSEADTKETEPMYIGPPDPTALVRNTTGEPTNRVLTFAPFTADFYLDSKIIGNAIPYWTLTLTGHDRPIAEGHKLPARISHTIIAPGTHTAVFFVSDGGARAVERITIELERPQPPPPVVFNGTLTGAWLPGGGYLGEVDSHPFTLDRPVREIQVNLTTESGGALDLDFEVVAPDGTSFRRVNFNEPNGLLLPAEEAPLRITEERYTHQLGDWNLYVYPAVSLEGDYRIRVSYQ